MSYDIRGVVSAEAGAQAAQFLAAYEQVCAPLRDADVLRELTKLRMKVARKADDETDWEVMLEMWLDELAEYPADIVVETIRYWGRCEKWWPIWSEFKQQLDRRVDGRKALMEALRRVAERGASASNVVALRSPA